MTAIEPISKTKYGSYIWLCRCECGNYIKVIINNLTNGHTQSCGCLARESKCTHKLSKTRIYKIYYNMIQRCFNENAKEYEHYGGRSISVCKEWCGDNGFINFYKWAINNGYEDSLTIDRIDVEKNYSPTNCRWTTMKVQGNNRRNNKNINYNGEIHTLKEWENILGFKRGCLQSHLARGWDIERAFNEPVGYIKPGYNKYSYRMKNKLV